MKHGISGFAPSFGMSFDINAEAGPGTYSINSASRLAFVVCDMYKCFSDEEQQMMKQQLIKSTHRIPKGKDDDIVELEMKIFF